MSQKVRGKASFCKTLPQPLSMADSLAWHVDHVLVSPSPHDSNIQRKKNSRFITRGMNLSVFFFFQMCMLPSELSKYPGQVVRCFPENGIGPGEVMATHSWLSVLATAEATVIVEFLTCASDSCTWKVSLVGSAYT